MGWLPTSIVPREVHFAHVDFTFRLAEIYVPFVSHTGAVIRYHQRRNEQAAKSHKKRRHRCVI